MYSQALDRAYHQTSYLIESPVRLELRLEQHCQRIADWLMAADCRSAVVITAYNPTKTLAPDENNRRQAALHNELSTNGRRLFSGHNVPDDQSAPYEPTLAVAGPQAADALELARRWDQNAVVLIDRLCVPQLIWA